MVMTTTEASLNRVDDIIDEYLQLGLGGIFLRPLSPFVFAVKTKQFQKYYAGKWLGFYERGLRRIQFDIERDRPATLVIVPHDPRNEPQVIPIPPELYDDVTGALAIVGRELAAISS